jgi:hypothetical protein
MWRTLLSLAFTQSDILSASTYAPPLRHRIHPSEPEGERSHRNFLHANIICYTGSFSSTICLSRWLYFRYRLVWRFFSRARQDLFNSKPTSTHINVLNLRH